MNDYGSGLKTLIFRVWFFFFVCVFFLFVNFVFGMETTAKCAEGEEKKKFERQVRRHECTTLKAEGDVAGTRMRRKKMCQRLDVKHCVHII